jgi:hypothetical protein
MPSSDQLVLAGVAIGTPLAAFLLRRRGARGRLWFSASWLAFFGIALLLMMSAHTVEVIYNTIHGGKTIEGSAWGYNFRTYSLLLLAGVLLSQAVRALRAAALLARGDGAARKRALSAAAIVLAVSAPLIPVHAFFGMIWTVLGALTLAVLALAPHNGSAPPRS